MLNEEVATQDTITPLAECLLRQADRYRLREFAIHKSDGAPDEREPRPKHEPPGYQACMMARRNVASASGDISLPDASPPRCAQLMGLASRGCLVFVLGATAERRNLLFRSDLGLPWAASKHPCTSRYPQKPRISATFPPPARSAAPSACATTSSTFTNWPAGPTTRQPLPPRSFSHQAEQGPSALSERRGRSAF